MARVLVSSSRITSMLKNRRLSLDQLAAIGLKSVDVHQFQHQDLSTEFDELIVMAKFFKRTWAYLLEDEPEVLTRPDHDNRTFQNQEIGYSVGLLEEYEFASNMLVAADELFPGSGFVLPIDLSLEDHDITRSAEQVRDLLGVADERQLSTKDDFASLRMWISATHECGIYVTQRRLNDTTVRAFSMIYRDQALIAVDTADTPSARVFSLLHELGHLLLRSTGACDLNDALEIERRCNKFAAEVLMPTSVLHAASARDGWSGAVADDNRLATLSRHIGASQAAILIRLLELGWITERIYIELERRRSVRRPAERKAGGDYYRTAINKVGRRYATNVYQAFEDGQIDRSDTSSLLGVGEHLVARFERELRAGTA